MSTIANWSYTSKATIWRASEPDEYGDISFSLPFTIMCSWQRGSGSVAEDDTGKMIKPLIIVWTELINSVTGDVEAPPVEGDMVAIGEFSDALPVSSARSIVSVIEDDMSAMMSGLNDFTISCKP